MIKHRRIQERQKELRPDLDEALASLECLPEWTFPDGDKDVVELEQQISKLLGSEQAGKVREMVDAFRKSCEIYEVMHSSLVKVWDESYKRAKARIEDESKG